MKKLTKRSKKGFTLVELIVVIAILAILAGVAIPVYTGYIEKAKEAADLQTLDSIKTAATFAAMTKNPAARVSEINITNKGNNIEVKWQENGVATSVTQTALAEYTDGTVTMDYIQSADWNPVSGWYNITKQP